MTVPGSVAGLAPDGPDWMARAIRDLQREVAMLRTAASLQAATVGAGGLTIKDGGRFEMYAPNGQGVVTMGEWPLLDGSGRTQMVVYFGRDDGTLAMALADQGVTPGHPHQQALVWFDRSGNVVFGDDTNGGQGVALPHMQQSPFISFDFAQWPNTSKQAWTQVGSMQLNMWQPGVFFLVGIAVGGGTGMIGNARIKNNSNGKYIWTSGDAPFPNISLQQFTWYPADWKPGDTISIDFEAKMSDSGGTAYVNVFQCYGVGSPID